MLVPGGAGQVGTDVAAAAAAVGADVLAPTSGELDLTQTGAVVAAVKALSARAKEAGSHPMVVNAAAYTGVDDAESHEQRAFRVNADGPRVLAAACSAHRVSLVHLSTDYVFSGEATQPYEPDDALAPRSAYGRTKAAGEAAVLRSGVSAWVVRTSWVYGAAGTNFVKTMARLERERETLSVVDDQRGCPTWSADFAAGLVELTTAIAEGRGPQRRTLHCTGSGETTWFEFARAVFTELGADPERVRPCATAEFPRPAPRPAYSVLSNASWVEAGFSPLREWRQALTEFFARHRDAL